MPDIRLVALDLDGTVFNDEKEITPRTLVQHAEPDDFLRHGNGGCHGQHHRAGRREQAVLERAAG